jgi:TolB-like protein/Tfp pilus assembly protein PilF
MPVRTSRFSHPPGSHEPPSENGHGELISDRAGFSSEEIEAELGRILSSQTFRNAPRHSRFLSFVVRRTLAGEAASLKEYVIGVEVFDRGTDYDPGSDATVRAEAKRLRWRLAEYYRDAGKLDAICIELPKGGYVPVFRPGASQPKADIADPAVTSPPQTRRARVSGRALAALILVAAISLASTLYYVRLRRSKTRAPSSIAVLPLLNLGAGPQGEYLGPGIAEELTTDLAQLNGLRVVAATSAFQFRGKPDDVRKIGQALNTEALMEGSITPSGDRLRIDAQLVDTRNGYHLWSKAYDVQTTDLPVAENDIVQQAARVLQVPIIGGHEIKRDTENPEAHNLYLQGRYLWNSRQLPDMLESIRLFERAIKDDPHYALAYSGLADTYTVMAINTQMSPAEALPRAKAALQRALELDPNLARAHATLGLLKSQCEWDWHGAEQEFRKAIELDPNYASAHHWAGLNYMEMGQFAVADAELRQAQVLDPLSPMITEGLAENFVDARRYDDAIATVRSMPNPKVGWAVLAEAYIFKGASQEALQIPEVADAKDLTQLTARAEALARSGDRDGGLKILKNLEREQKNTGARDNYIPPGVLGYAYAIAGEKEPAFLWLEKAYQQHDPALANLKANPGFDSLRSDPRYLELLKKVGLSN